MNSLGINNLKNPSESLAAILCVNRHIVISMVLNNQAKLGKGNRSEWFLLYWYTLYSLLVALINICRLQSI